MVRPAVVAAALAVLLAGTIVLAGAGCGDAELKAAGEPCVASSECAAGLVCDLVAASPVCTDHITTDARVIDAAIDAFMPIDAGADAAPDAMPDAMAAAMSGSAAVGAPGL